MSSSLILLSSCSNDSPDISSMTNPPTYHSNTGYVDVEGDKIVNLSKAEIQKVQTYLKGHGHLEEVTGKLDDTTSVAVKKFQTENNLKVTGDLTVNTLKKMGINYDDSDELAE